MGKFTPFIRRFPNTAFAVVLGLGGNSILWKLMHATPFTSQFAPVAMNYIFWLSGIAFLVVFSTMYVVKAYTHFDIVCEEWHDPVRCNFMNVPNLGLMMLAIGAPQDLSNPVCLNVIWAFSFLWQSTLTHQIYYRWMFASQSPAALPNLLSVVGWFFLTILSNEATIVDDVGIGLNFFCFGIGTFFSSVVYMSIMQNLHQTNMQGTPATFLLCAPISVASLALEGLTGGYGGISKSILGVAIFLAIIIFSAGPHIRADPGIMGQYWAYTFPPSALAASAINNAKVEDSVFSKVVAWVAIVVAVFCLLFAATRMLLFQYEVSRGSKFWKDPLVTGRCQPDTCVPCQSTV